MADIVMIRLDHLNAHPDNPRKDLGDLSELVESIKAKGILQNLTVIRGHRGTDEQIAEIQKFYDTLTGDTQIERDAMQEIKEQIENKWVATGYTVVIGHRRLAAARLAGLTELPCAIVELPYKEQIQTMMVENMQRADLTVFEQAQGFQMMLDLGSPVEEIAEKTGFSDTTVRRRLKWMELDREKFKKATDDGSITIGDLDRLSQIKDIASRNECLSKIGTRDFDMSVQKAIRLQDVDANMPAVKAWLKEIKAKAIKGSNRWDNKYEEKGQTIYINRWGDDENKPPKDIEKKPVFYYLGKKGEYDYGQLDLYHEREKAAPVKRPQEEIDREKAIKAAWDKIESAAAAAYDLRKKFVDGLTVTKKNEQQVIFGAVIANCFEAISFNCPDRTTLYKLAGIKDTGYIPDRDEKFWAGFDKISGNDWAKLVYALFGDESICGASGYRREFPEFRHNIKLELIYRWISSLGYKISTEEAQLLTGDHEAYKAGENYGKV